MQIINVVYSFLFAAAMLPVVHSLGINCRGSSQCGLSGGNLMVRIRDQACGNQGQTWCPGERRAKVCGTGNSISAYVQSTNNCISGTEACRHLTNLVNHGCRVCGSDPLYAGNDVSRGQLTVNYVNSC
uniref:KP4 killer toxin n=2 Tax=root TaxID=1 RepID=KP4T_UMV4|nr:RecName: Full=KP4 killer toxin; AltName: Full=Fungal toxin KP4; AltName: Full=Killer protein 4; Flags: Precursor [Ustilago maydis virus P4]AAA75041.1 protoxin [Ustilago maydis virus P4]AAA89185.1 KP4 toxin [Ustilago maydis virus P4]